jgi:uncharacterized protein
MPRPERHLAYCVIAMLLATSPHAAHAQAEPAAVAGSTHSTQAEPWKAGDEMTDPIKLIHEWLDMVAMGPAEAWTGKVAQDVIIRLPFAPPGVAGELRGFDHARETLGEHWKTKQSFKWRDVVIRRTEDPELLLTTARSEVILRSGQPYANNYIMLTRIRDGKVIEHIEYFNPLPIMEMLRK